MKPKGSHPQKALTAAAIRNKSAPGKYSDGSGLYLVVDPSGNKRWLLRITVRGKRRDIGLGGWPTVSLADARESATAMRLVARKGGDPLADRRKRSEAPPSFREASKQVHAEHKASWKNAKHASQWLKTLESYAFPYFADMPVNEIGTAEVLTALSPIWLTKSETARRVRQRIGTVLDWAKANGYRVQENAVRSVTKGLPKQSKSDWHHSSLPYSELPAFLPKLRAYTGSRSSVLAFEFLILTATRTNEVIRATWSEFDLERKEWIIPAERMKAKKVFRVPLPKRALEILAEAREIDRDGRFVFPGRRPGKPLSQMAFLMILRRINQAITAHGFRSTFRDWAAERTNIPREVCEAALAHTVRNRTEAAYMRTDQLEKRRKLMDAWAKFATTTKADSVVPLRAIA